MSKKTSWYCNVVLILMLLLCSNFVGGKGVISDANEQLRHIFEKVNHPTDFLYDRSAHILGEEYFCARCSVLTNCDNWFYAYSEMYNSAVDTMKMVPIQEIVSHTLDFKTDTIPFGVLDYQFCRLRPEVFERTKDRYFAYDEEDNLIYMKSDYIKEDEMGEIYTIDTIFMASPLVESSESLTPTFRIGELYFADNEMRELYAKGYYEVYVDWGNGDKGQKIDIIKETDFTVEYPKEGEYTISVDVYFEGALIKHSASSIIIRNNTKSHLLENLHVVCKDLDFYKEKLGLKVLEFTSEEGNEPKYEKIIFVLSGYNPLAIKKNYTGREAADLYKKYIVDGNMHQLLYFNYKFVIVDWVQPNLDIRENAYSLSKLLNEYIAHNQNDEEFVVIGHSMGCLVGRYALLRMEDEKEPWAKDIKKKHNTRLFISNDGPHQGVNIPMSLQCIYGDAVGPNGYLSDFIDYLSANRRYNIDLVHTGLNGVSVQQMLNRHYETARKIAEDTYYYSEHPRFDDFFADMKEHGDYPQFCKLVTLTNGSLNGAGQENMYYNSNKNEFLAYPLSTRKPNDHIIYMQNQFCFRILGFRFTTDIKIDILSNPLGTGPLFDMSYTHYTPHLKVFWFGIRVDYDVFQVSYTRNGANLLPYCTSAGGNEYFKRSKSAFNCSWGCWFDLGVFGISVADIPGKAFSLQVRAGIPWLLDSSGSISLYTDGLGFGFVPVNSAIDYRPDKQDEYVTDFSTKGVDEIIHHTPFDVVIGRYDYIEKEYSYNGNHESVINPILYNSKENRWYEYSFCSESRRRLLNAEIGDETIFLENRIQPWNATLAIPGEINNEPVRANYYLYPGYKVSETAESYNINVKALSDKECYKAIGHLDCITAKDIIANIDPNVVRTADYQFDDSWVCSVLPKQRTYKVQEHRNDSTIVTPQVQNLSNEEPSCTIYSSLGIYIGQGKYNLRSGQIASPKNLPAGIYLVSYTIENETKTIKTINL